MIGEKLKLLRTKKGLSQEELSKILKMSRSTYVHYELDKRSPPYETIRLFADFFSVTSDFLLGLSDDPKLNQIADTKTLKELEEAKKAMDEAADRYFKILEKHSLNGK